MTRTKVLQQERAIRTRGRLVEAATSLLLQKGLDVSVDELVVSAGVSKGSFYFHFRSRDDVISEVMATLASDPKLVVFRPLIRRVLKNPRARLLLELKAREVRQKGGSSNGVVA